MTPAYLLHCFARRHCIEESAKWMRLYKPSTGSKFNAKSWGIFPRYRQLDAILDAIERIDSDDLPDPEELRQLIIRLAEVAPLVFGPELNNPVAQNACEEERDAFVTAVLAFDPYAAIYRQPLFYRRSLSDGEVKTLKANLAARWGMKDTSYWYPIGDRTHPSLIAYDLSAVQPLKPEARIRSFLKKRSETRILELHEFSGGGVCVDASRVVFSYISFGTYGERVWTSDLGDWVIYCSHEDTITFGGAITSIVDEDWKPHLIS